MTRSGMPPTSMLVNADLEITKDLAPWYAVSSGELAPDYLNVYCEGSGQESRHPKVFCRWPPGSFWRVLRRLRAGLACFQQGKKYVVRDLAAGQVLASGPHPFRWYAGGDQGALPARGRLHRHAERQTVRLPMGRLQGGVF